MKKKSNPRTEGAGAVGRDCLNLWESVCVCENWPLHTDTARISAFASLNARHVFTKESKESARASGLVTAIRFASTAPVSSDGCCR